MAKTKTAQLTVQEKFQRTRQELNEALIERETEVDILLTAMICGEHPLFVGPPGTAKSLMLDSMMAWMGDVSKFSILFNRFTTAEEVFGPVSVKGLKEDVYRRITTGKLPEAVVAFIDEIFKAGPSTLNIILRLLNERVFENGDGVFRKVPLVICVAASNEWPQSQEELGALFDRFLLRRKVSYISSRRGREKLLWVRSHHPQLSTSLSINELDTAAITADTLEFTDTAKADFEKILDELQKEGIRPGDRRIYKAVDAVKAYAYLNGRELHVETPHLEILSHILWDDPAEQPEKCAKIVGRIANPIGLSITDKLIQVQDIISKRTPTEAVPALQVIQKELQELPKGTPNDGKIKAAIRYVGQEIKTQFQRVTGEYQESEV